MNIPGQGKRLEHGRAYLRSYRQFSVVRIGSRAGVMVEARGAKRLAKHAAGLQEPKLP